MLPGKFRGLCIKRWHIHFMKLKQIHCTPETTCFSIPLEPRKIIKKSINQSALGLILMIAIGWAIGKISGFIAEGTGIDWYNVIIQNALFLVYFGILLIFFLLNIFFQILYFRYYFYDLTPEEVVIMKGVVSRNRISIHYEKIQNIFIDQDFLDRIFKLYDVHLATADSQSATVAHIDGVSKENAERLKSILDEKIKNRQKGDGI